MLLVALDIEECSDPTESTWRRKHHDRTNKSSNANHGSNVHPRNSCDKRHGHYDENQDNGRTKVTLDKTEHESGTCCRPNRDNRAPPVI